VQEFLQGLVGGVAIVWLVHSTSILLGFATLREGSSSFLFRPFDLLKYSSNSLLLALRGFITATSIAVVEEVVFRSWLPEEVAVDLGYYNAILMSGLAFSLIHRYIHFSHNPFCYFTAHFLIHSSFCCWYFSRQS
jgi:membrane protease YdiL (CAAX protease family)